MRAASKIAVDDDDLLTSAHVRAALGGISAATIYRWTQRANLKFPEPIKIAGRKFWRRGEVRAWCEAQLMQRMHNSLRDGGA
ncbi:helix-turn-helix transcriptional regulator [Rhodomicrobium sp.]|uniref:helix-turn-helix transcriptional regulator n=1 Tax=Rhodomicrobium sp. TaxID=2720632 RepID=UPI0039E24B53